MGISIEQNLQIESNIQYQNTNEYTPSSILDIRIIKTQNRLLLRELSTLNKSRFIAFAKSYWNCMEQPVLDMTSNQMIF
jgi:hypothetical protein